MHDDSSSDHLTAMSVTAYSAAADTFDDPVLSFWDRFGRETVRRVGLHPGASVLDACCGTGASALPAAQAVGSEGSVLGVDIAEPALVLARTKAAAFGLSNVEFRIGDVTNTGLPSGSSDAVVCVFGVFFLTDMSGLVQELWRMVRPGGVLAVTVWGPGFMHPATAAFWDAVGTENPDLVEGFQPWTRVTDAAGLTAVFAAAGLDAPTVEPEDGTHPLNDPQDWWKIVMGTGFRATVDQLEPAGAARVRQASIERLRRDGIDRLAANVIYARVAKPVG